MMQAAGAHLRTSKRRSLGVIAARSPMVSVVPTAVSAAGPGTPTIPNNGLEKVQPAGANTGGVIELVIFCARVTDLRLNRVVRRQNLRRNSTLNLLQSNILTSI